MASDRAAVALVLVFAWGAAEAEPFWGIKVRKTALETAAAEDLSKPATLSYNRPSSGESSYASDIALSKFFKRFGAEGKEKGYTWEASGFGEFHKNTLGSKRQDATFLGLNLNGQSAPIAPDVTVWFPRASFSLGRDRIKHATGILFQADTTWLNTGYGLNAEKHVGSVAFTWAPVLGVEHQRAVRTPTDTDRGAVTRFYAALDLSLTPIAALDVVTVTLSGKGWKEGARSGLYDSGERTRRFASAAINWYLYGTKDDKNAVVMSLTRETGENPTLGLPKSSVTKLAFKFKFN